MADKLRSHVREIIKAEELINKLQNSVLDDKVEALGQNDVNCIKILLSKALPDLKALEHTGRIDSEVTERHQVEFIGKDNKA